jgi:activator of HSP90 ATPase
MSQPIRQTVTFKAAPHDVYEALMDSRKHAAFTGDSAKISRKVGGAITAYGEYVTGRNVELVLDKKIVQAWHAADWPDGHESTVTFILKRVPGGTRLSFSHRDVPENDVEAIRQGWKDNYGEPMKIFLTTDNMGKSRKTREK